MNIEQLKSINKIFAFLLSERKSYRFTWISESAAVGVRQVVVRK